jgi:integrase
MVRKLRDARLETRSARSGLKGLTFKNIGPGLAIGYRRGARGGKWVARVYSGDRSYRLETIGWADDTVEADGVQVLTFWQAVAKAQALTAPAAAGPFTVAKAVAEYLRHLEGRRSYADTRLRLNAYVLPIFGDTEVARLTYDDLVKWHRDLAASPARLRSGRQPQRVRETGDDPERIRGRKVSANRILAQFRAALNLAFNHGKVPSDAVWRRVKPFKGVNAAKVRYLSNDEARRLLNACDGDFRVLVAAALQTGCRYQELARLRVSDFNDDVGAILICTSKTGHARHVVLTTEAQAFFAGLAAGRDGNEMLLGREWHLGSQGKPMRDACKRAKIEPAISIHGMRHTYASLSIMNGIPLLVVAKNLGHSNTNMVEKHYGHLAPSFVVDAIRAGAPTFGIKAGNVKAIR